MNTAIFILAIFLVGTAMGLPAGLPGMRCAMICDDELPNPICATVGTASMTFQNSCELGKYKCQNPMTILRVLHKGECV